MSYASTWLGGRFQSSTAECVPFSKCAAVLISSSFKADFVPFWAHANGVGKRAARLDKTQFHSIHNSNSAFQLCSLLSRSESLRVQRLAMQEGSSSLMSVDRIASLLGVEVPKEWETDQKSESEVHGSCIRSWIEKRFFSLPARSAALVLHFARCALLKETMISYDLGPRTKSMQEEALRKRLLVEEGTSLEEGLPMHATCLMCCSECRRVANACQNNAGKETPFNEIGVAACMLKTARDLKKSHLRCAKRSSAAVRTSLVLEEQAKQQMPEMDDMSESGTPRLDPISDSAEWTTVIGKLRRDAKNCMDQGEKALSCGDLPLVSINIVGRAVRVFGQFYCICAFCGTILKMKPDSFFSGQPCCGRCDASMLLGNDGSEEEAQRLAAESTPTCRFCGKHEILNSSSKWRCIPAPADDGGPNADVPPPLRTVHYCPSHFRHWLIAAHRSISTNVIFAHISNKAKPIYGAESGKRSLDEAERAERLAESGLPAPKKKKARKVPRPKQGKIR